MCAWQHMWKCVTRCTPSSSTGETIARRWIFHDYLRGCAWSTEYIRNLRWCETGGRKRRWKIASTRRERKKKEDEAKKERGPGEILDLRIQIKSPREDTYEKRNQSLYTVFSSYFTELNPESKIYLAPFSYLLLYLRRLFIHRCFSDRENTFLLNCAR